MNRVYGQLRAVEPQITFEKEHLTRTQSQKVSPESAGVPAEKGASWQHLCCSLGGFYLGMYRYQDVRF